MSFLSDHTCEGTCYYHIATTVSEDMSTITPIGSDKQQQVINETLKYIQLASDIFHHPFKPINILFNLSGQASGMFIVDKAVPVIRYNPYIFAKHFAYSLSNTIPHEVAHYISYCLHGHKNIRPHGNEWKALMLQFGAKPNRTSSLDLEGIPIRRQQRHPYSCNCTDHPISSRRHNMIRGGKVRYFCRSCKGELISTN